MSDEPEKVQPTPGPWVYDEISMNIRDDKNQIVAGLLGSNFDPDSEDVANGRLMAASPDLLAACEVAAEEVEAFRDSLTAMNDWAEAEASLLTIKAAIAKARGGQSC